MLVVCIFGETYDLRNQGKLLMQQEKVFMNEQYTVEREYQFEGIKLYQLQQRSPFTLYPENNFKTI